MAVIDRARHVSAVTRLLRGSPVVAILGARQVGKSTLARQIVASRARPAAWYDLEDPVDRQRLADPGVELRRQRGLVVLDEIQRLPEVFPLLRVLADRPRTPARFLILGSASIELLKQTSESLAGRVAFHHLDGFALDEVGNAVEQLWLRGGFPRAWLERSVRESLRWRNDFIRTFLERDVPQFGFRIPATTLRRFWTMLAHYHGQTWNGSELGRALGVSHTAVRGYLDALAGLLVVRVLPPWFENLNKRQVRAPKVYVADSGILHALLGIETLRDLTGHPKVGASWEGFLVQQVVEALGAAPEDCYHWSTHSGAELDLMVMHRGRRRGFEFKRSEAPHLTKSMHMAIETLRLDSLDVVHAGERTWAMGAGVRAVAAADLVQVLGGGRR